MRNSIFKQGTISLTIDRLFDISEVLGVTVSNILDFDQSKVFNIYNNTTDSGVISGNTVFQEGISAQEKALYDKLLAEKDRRIEQLEKEIERFSPQKAKKK